MARQFKVEGTKDFLLGAIVLLMFGLLCVKDGWIPSASTLAKHPRFKELTSSMDGTVGRVVATTGAEIKEGGRILIILDASNAENYVVAPFNGVVQRIAVAEKDVVHRGQPLASLKAEDVFYLFNQSLAILCLFGALVCGYIHWVLMK